MVMLVVAVAEGQPPEAGMVLVTVYVPGVVAARFTDPVDGSMLNPGAAENVPALPPPLNTGEGSVPPWQNEEAE